MICLVFSKLINEKILEVVFDESEKEKEKYKKEDDDDLL